MHFAYETVETTGRDHIAYITIIQHFPKVFPQLRDGRLKFRGKSGKAASHDRQLAVARPEQDVRSRSDKPYEASDVVREIQGDHHLPP